MATPMGRSILVAGGYFEEGQRSVRLAVNIGEQGTVGVTGRSMGVGVDRKIRAASGVGSKIESGVFTYKHRISAYRVIEESWRRMLVVGCIWWGREGIPKHN